MSFIGRITGSDKRKEDERLKLEVDKVKNARFLISANISKEEMVFDFKDSFGEIGIAGIKLIGQFTISVRKDSEFKNVISLVNNKPIKLINVNGGYSTLVHHPHKNNSICFGNMKGDIYKALEDRQYFQFALLMNIFLKGCNIGDTLTSPSYWANLKDGEERIQYV